MTLHLDESQETRIPRGCLAKARALYPSLKEAERAALTYLLQEPEQVCGASITDTARRAGCGIATLSRLARRLGYPSYAALKKAFGETARSDSSASVIYRAISGADSPENILEKVFAASIESLRDTLEVLQREEFRRAVAAVCGARRLLFCGLGDAAQVAATIAQKFVRADIDARAAEDPDTQMILAAHLREGDVAVGISHSGRSVPVINALAEAGRRGATTIALTNYPRSPLARVARIVLLTADFAEDLNGEVVSKRISELCVLESLYICRVAAASTEVAPALARAREAVITYKTNRSGTRQVTPREKTPPLTDPAGEK